MKTENTILIIVMALAGIALLTLSAVSIGSKGETDMGSIVCFLIGLILIVGSYPIFFFTYNGYLADPSYLNEKIIYRVEGQIKTSNGKNTVVVRNATDHGEPHWVKNPEPLAPDVRFVKVVEGEKGGYKLVPFEIKKADE